MKNFLLSLILLSTISSANPFDQFIGTYRSVSPADIQNENTSECTRYGFPNLSTIEVRETNGEGYEQTHIIKLSSSLNGSPLDSNYAVMEFRDEIEHLHTEDVVHYAYTSGDPSTAHNETGSETAHRIDKMSLRLTRTDTLVVLEITETLIHENGRMSCIYRMDFVED